MIKENHLLKKLIKKTNKKQNSMNKFYEHINKKV